MSIIKILDPKLANMIAAGEVVDRPASVLKELVENAIDAKATEINVVINDMGMGLIAVSDNGIGMDQSDAHLALQRHATSKIHIETDLSHIHTLGFRGEALAAISSVSKMTIKTRQKDSEGYYVTYHGNKHMSEGSTSHNIGTTVEVKELFYNTPARFKYIKSEQAEKAAIIDIFDRLALANPSIAFRLTMDQKLVKETFGNQDMYQLIDLIYGQEVTKGLIRFEKTVGKITLKGYLIRPEINRSRKKDISLFVNGRYIKNYALTQAIIDGYHSYLMVGKYPIALLHMDMDPSLLDVNVHPQKFEVKFMNESMLSYHIETYVKEALSQKAHVIPEKVLKPSFQESYEQQALSFHDPAPIEPITIAETSDQKIPDMEFVGIYAGTYLIFQNEDGLFMMDQHAAMERVRYEHYFSKLGTPTTSTKELLIPYKPAITKQDQVMIHDDKKTFEQIGFHFNDAMELTMLPTWIREQEIDTAIEHMLTMLHEKQAIDLSLLRDHLAKDISCKGSIRANQAISRIEIDHLYQALRGCKNPYTCPHGRPTIIKITQYEIEKMFQRVVS